MKFSYLLSASLLLFGMAKAASNYEMTYYGCPDECETQEHPSCGNGINTKYFAALDTSLKNEFCDKYVVVMETKSGASKMVKAKVVDSCGDCGKYHVDLSVDAFTALASKSVGRSSIIWAVYDSSGSKVDGPFYNSVSSVAKSYNLSESGFASAFEKSAASLARGGSNKGNFSASGASSEEKKTTTRNTPKTTTTVKKTVVQTTTKVNPPSNPVVNKPVPSVNPSTNPSTNPNPNPVPSSNPNSPITNGPVTTIPTVPNTNNSTLSANNSTIIGQTNNNSNLPVANNNNNNNNNNVKVEQQDSKEDGEGEEEEKGGSGFATAGTVLAIGGSVLGAAGVGLFVLKKKSPGKYEDMKTKFPEAFNQVTRSLTKNLKRSVTRISGRKNTTTATMNNVTGLENEQTVAQLTSIRSMTVDKNGVKRISLYDAPC